MDLIVDKNRSLHFKVQSILIHQHLLFFTTHYDLFLIYLVHNLGSNLIILIWKFNDSWAWRDQKSLLDMLLSILIFLLFLHVLDCFMDIISLIKIHIILMVIKHHHWRRSTKRQTIKLNPWKSLLSIYYKYSFKELRWLFWDTFKIYLIFFNSSFHSRVWAANVWWVSKKHLIINSSKWP